MKEIDRRIKKFDNEHSEKKKEEHIENMRKYKKESNNELESKIDSTENSYSKNFIVSLIVFIVIISILIACLVVKSRPNKVLSNFGEDQSILMSKI